MPKLKPDTKEKAIRYFIQKMDIEMLDDILDDKVSFGDFSKSKFLTVLQGMFTKLNASGDTHLIPKKGVCTHCLKGKKGFTFKGNNSNFHFILIFNHLDEGKLDLRECRSFSRINKYCFSDRLYFDKSNSINI